MDKLQRLNDFNSIIRIIEKVIEKNRSGGDKYKKATNLVLGHIISILNEVKKDNDVIVNFEKYG